MSTPGTDRPPDTEPSASDASDNTQTHDYPAAASAYVEATAQRIHESAAVHTASRSRRAVLVAVLLSLAANVAVAVVQLVSATEYAIVFGIAVVVLLGAGGLVSRGVGELRNSPAWKASGCFLCGAAYVGTASVAMINGVPLIFQS